VSPVEARKLSRRLIHVGKDKEPDSALGHVSETTQPSLSSGDGRARTADPLLAKQVLSQLSYIPTKAFGPVVKLASVGLSGFEPETSRLSAVRSHQLS
jgi:hypothetical protein